MEHILTIEEAEALVAKALMANSVSGENAACVAKALIAAEVDGQGGHGLARVLSYSAQAKVGKVVGDVTPSVEMAGTAFVRIDARDGFAFPAIDLAIRELKNLTGKTGIAAAAITNSHHCGQLGAHVEKLAEQGMIGLMVANAPKAMAPWGGDQALFGTNPVAFAAPRREAAPLVIDLSLSKVARGKVMAAKKKGETIPEGWGLDKAGHPSTDPDAVLEGMMLPMGDAKGSALALIVEILAATLTGAKNSYQASSFFDAKGAPVGVGQFMIAVDPACAMAPAFHHRLEELASQIEGQSGARLPGMRRLQSRALAREHGIKVPAHLMAEITQAIND